MELWDLTDLRHQPERAKQLMGRVQRVTCNSTVVSETGGSGDGLLGDRVQPINFMVWC